MTLSCESKTNMEKDLPIAVATVVKPNVDDELRRIADKYDMTNIRMLCDEIKNQTKEMCDTCISVKYSVEETREKINTIFKEEMLRFINSDKYLANIFVILDNGDVINLNKLVEMRNIIRKVAQDKYHMYQVVCIHQVSTGFFSRKVDCRDCTRYNKFIDECYMHVHVEIDRWLKYSTTYDARQIRTDVLDIIGKFKLNNVVSASLQNSIEYSRDKTRECIVNNKVHFISWKFTRKS